MATATALYAYYTFCHCSGSPRGLPTSVRKSCSYNHHREMHTHHCMVQHLTPFYRCGALCIMRGPGTGCPLANPLKQHADSRGIGDSLCLYLLYCGLQVELCSISSGRWRIAYAVCVIRTHGCVQSSSHVCSSAVCPSGSSRSCPRSSPPPRPPESAAPQAWRRRR